MYVCVHTYIYILHTYMYVVVEVDFLIDHPPSVAVPSSHKTTIHRFCWTIPQTCLPPPPRRSSIEKVNNTIDRKTSTRDLLSGQNFKKGVYYRWHMANQNKWKELKHESIVNIHSPSRQQCGRPFVSCSGDARSRWRCDRPWCWKWLVAPGENRG